MWTTSDNASVLNVKKWSKEGTLFDSEKFSKVCKMLHKELFVIYKYVTMTFILLYFFKVPHNGAGLELFSGTYKIHEGLRAK